MSNKICLFLFWIISFGINSQDLKYDYKPIRSYGPPREIIDDYKLRFTAWGQNNDIEPENVKQTFIKFAKQKANFIHILDSLSIIMYSDPISNFLNSIKDDIVSGNENLNKQDYIVFTYRSLEPNAFNLGEGLILVSTGLLEKVTSVDQLAFIISHEIAHDVLDHVYNNLQRISKSLNEEQFKKSLHKTKRKRFGKNTELKNLINSFMSVHMEYSRNAEFQADSLGYIFFQKAGFQPTEAVNSLNILDASDRLRYEDTLNFREYFNFIEYPFKSYWLETEKSALNLVADTAIYQIPDSLKTHPDCDSRIERLEEIPVISIINRESNDANTNLEELASVIPFEILETLINSKDYVIALFLSMHMQAEYPENVYLKCVTANCLYELGEAISGNQFLEFVEFPDDEFSPGYNQVLIFLHNMSSSSLRNLYRFYIKEHLSEISDNPYVGYLQVLNSTDKEITIDVVSQYELTFKDSHFTTLLKDKIYKTRISKE